MKKMMLLVALMIGASIFVNANTLQDQDPTAITEKTTAVMEDEGYAVVKMDALNAKVKETIQNYSNDFTVKALSYNSDKKLTKVTLVSKADNSEKVVILDNEGKEVKE